MVKDSKIERSAEVTAALELDKVHRRPNGPEPSSQIAGIYAVEGDDIVRMKSNQEPLRPFGKEIYLSIQASGS